MSWHVIEAGWYMEGDPALINLQDNREFRPIVNDRNMLVKQDRAKLENGCSPRALGAGVGTV